MCVLKTLSGKPRRFMQTHQQKLMHLNNVCSSFQVKFQFQFTAQAVAASCLHLPVQLEPWLTFHYLSPVSTVAPPLWTDKVHRGVTKEEPQPDQVTTALSVTSKPQPSYVWFNSGHTECSTTCGTGNLSTKLQMWILNKWVTDTWEVFVSTLWNVTQKLLVVRQTQRPLGVCWGTLPDHCCLWPLRPWTPTTTPGRGLQRSALSPIVSNVNAWPCSVHSFSGSPLTCLIAELIHLVTPNIQLL